jgi:glycosyltransferase involved in cell wall biosynthesis
MSTKPLISVVVNTYNHERFIEKAVRSVLDQDFPADLVEVVAVDDGSTDHTFEVLQQFQPRLRVIRKSNGGQGSALNAGIAATTGNLVAFCDGDDWWAKTKLTECSNALNANPKVAALGHSYYEAFDDGPPSAIVAATEDCYIDDSTPEAARIANHGRTFLGTTMLVIRRSILEKIGPVPDGFVMCADAPILSMAVALGGAIILKNPLCYYRVHGGNFFHHAARNPQGLRRKAQILALAAKCLAPRFEEIGMLPEIRTIVLEAYQIESERLARYADGQAGWDAHQLELRDLHTLGADAGPLYNLFKRVSGSLAALLPADRYYALRSWYARKNLKRFRQAVAPIEVAPWERMFQRRALPRPD